MKPRQGPIARDGDAVIELQISPSSLGAEKNVTVGEKTSGRISTNGGPLVLSNVVGSEEESIDDESTSGNGKDGFTSGSGNHFQRNPLQRMIKLGLRGYEFLMNNPVVSKVLRRSMLPPTKDGRHISLFTSRPIPLIDERTGKEYINNAIRSSRYTLITFLPHQLWFQFSKIANLYFLITGIIQLIPGLSTTGTYTTILPLMFFLLFTVAREGWDDWRRYRLDKIENGKMAKVLGGAEINIKFSVATASKTLFMQMLHVCRKLGRQALRKTPVVCFKRRHDQDSTIEDLFPWRKVEWIHVKVGDIIELSRDEQVPADIVMLHADGRDGVAYVETMALDGETNLKSRYPVPQLKCQNVDDISNCHAHFVVEDPNLDLYDFHGKVTLDGTTLPLTVSNVVFRGSIVRNTTRVIGMVINTGEECKIRMNASKNPEAKSPTIQKMTNRVVILLAVFVVLLASGCTVGYVVWKRDFERHAWYLNNASVRMIDIFVAFAIMFNNLIPLALYVSLELVKLAQFLLLHDVEMYDEASNTPMVSNTQNIYENLGQVTHILSDKTGTLTENVMRLRKMTIGGEIWTHKEKCAESDSSSGPEIQNGKKSTDVKVLALGGTSDQSIRKSAVGNNPRITLEVPSGPQRPSLSITFSHGEAKRSDNIVEYIQSNPRTALADKLRFFILSLAICHTCFPEAENSGKIGFQAASPDELALVEAAQDLGYLLIDRTTQIITILTPPNGIDTGSRECYEVLNIIEFSSKRKRMSILVKFPDGRICLFCKGADSVIIPRFRKDLQAADAASIVQDRRLQRVSMEVEEALVRKSTEIESRKSFQRSSLNIGRPSMNISRPSLSISRPGPPNRNNSSGYFGRKSLNVIDQDLGSGSLPQSPISPGGHRRSMGNFSSRLEVPSRGPSFQSERRHDIHDEAGTIERCLEHIVNFASDGLRTLVFGYRYLSQEEYDIWASLHHSATTSLTNRQEQIEAVAEQIEKDFDLAGATGIEDKLQDGVPETITKLQRANIKISILTGDKRETAINIAHSAGICKAYSEIVILDGADTVILEQMSLLLEKLDAGRVAHSVLVIDGQTLVDVEANDSLKETFYSLLLRVDSTICTRAYPSQKALLVKRIRTLSPKSITLAIGDGGNDIAMIQEAHVGIGISGKEGLQAARVADYSIAQFRFLQRLLLVHGHWLYLRTAKFILLTFWKEMLFYIVQALYQKWNGYTGTSLFESWSLAVWNTLFTALPVMIPGIFEQDLCAETLLEVPELYAYGQGNQGFNMRKYWWWMFMATCEAVLIYFMVIGLYGPADMSDQGLFATGDLAFSICVVFINVKLL
jgi:phospholipid-translocating ATPase